jgi:hypothetical protein
MLTEERLDKAEAFFNRHGGKIVTVARFIEGLRQANGIIAGISGMRWIKFLAFNALGAALWVATWTAVGYLAGDHIQTIYDAVGRYALYLLAAAAALVIALVVRRERRRRQRRVAMAAEESGAGQVQAERSEAEQPRAEERGSAFASASEPEPSEAEAEAAEIKPEPEPSETGEPEPGPGPTAGAPAEEVRESRESGC